MVSRSHAAVQERRRRIVELAQAGETVRSIAGTVGISERGVARHLRAAGVADLRLAGKRTPPEGGDETPEPMPLRPVRLADVPLEDRLKAAHTVLESCKDERERADLLGAVVAPSSTVFWVAGDRCLQKRR